MAQAGGDKVKLGYWKFRGVHRGNGARYLLAYSGAQWEEQSFTFSSEDWPTFKSGGTVEFPNLPFIIDGDVNVTETFAVHRYIADKFKPELLGSTPAERAKVMQLYSIVNDKFINALVKLVFAEGTTREQLNAASLGALETGVGPLLNDDRQFLNGANVCLADFIFFETIEYANQIAKG